MKLAALALLATSAFAVALKAVTAFSASAHAFCGRKTIASASRGMALRLLPPSMDERRAPRDSARSK